MIEAKVLVSVWFIISTKRGLDAEGSAFLIIQSAARQTG